MGLFDSLFSRKPEMVGSPKSDGYWQTLTAYRPTFTTRNGSAYESELVRSAIDARARHISKLALEIRGSAKPSLKAKLMKKPNDFQTYSQWFYRISTILDMQGTCFLLPVYGIYGEVTGIYPVLPSRCEVVDVKGIPWLRYRFDTNKTGACELNSVGILTKFQYQSDLFGTSNDALNKTLDLIDLQNQGITEAVKNSASYRFMAKMTNFSKQEDMALERQRFDANNFGADAKKGGVLLFPSQWSDIKQLDPKNYVVDSAQVEQIQTNVFNYFGVNEDVIQNKALGDSLDAFFNGCIEPFSVLLSQVLTKMLFTEKEQGYGNEILITANRLQYMSVDKKISLAQQLGDRGMITINEIRELFNYPPLDVGGDRLPIRGEYYLINQDGTTTKEDEETEGIDDAN